MSTTIMQSKLKKKNLIKKNQEQLPWKGFNGLKQMVLGKIIYLGWEKYDYYRLIIRYYDFHESLFSRAKEGYIIRSYSSLLFLSN